MLEGVYGVVFCPIITGKGIANELMSWKDSVVFAKALGGDVCLPTLVNGKTLRKSTPNAVEVVDIQRIYDIKHMCLNQQCVPCKLVCNTSCTIGILKRNEMSNILQLKTRGRYNQDRWDNWSGVSNNPGCVHNVYLKPGYLYFNIDVTYYSQLQLQLRPPSWIRSLALENSMSIFRGGKFVSIHWRFEETKCRRRLGSCVRSIFLGSQDNFVVPKEVIIETIKEFAQKYGSERAIYIASDACLRHSCTLLDSVASRLGAYTSKNLYQHVLRQRPGLQPWSIDFASVEQEFCSIGTAFMGSSVSSWSHEIYFKRAVAANDTMLLKLVIGLNNESKLERQNIISVLKAIHASGSNKFFDLALLQNMPSHALQLPYV